MEPLLLLNREIIEEIVVPPRSMVPMRYMRVAIDNDEAQHMLAKKWRVNGDSRGPLLTVKLTYPLRDAVFSTGDRADMLIHPIPWMCVNVGEGVTCWLQDLTILDPVA